MTPPVCRRVLRIANQTGGIMKLIKSLFPSKFHFLAPSLCLFFNNPPFRPPFLLPSSRPKEAGRTPTTRILNKSPVVTVSAGLSVLTGGSGATYLRRSDIRQPLSLGSRLFTLEARRRRRRGLDRTGTGAIFTSKDTLFFFFSLCFFHKKGRGGTPPELTREGLSLK